jgi:hypothetical protein
VVGPSLRWSRSRGAQAAYRRTDRSTVSTEVWQVGAAIAQRDIASLEPQVAGQLRA